MSGNDDSGSVNSTVAFFAGHRDVGPMLVMMVRASLQHETVAALSNSAKSKSCKSIRNFHNGRLVVFFCKLELR